MAAITKFELEEIVEKLEGYKGRATELITVYIPAGQNIHTVSNQLEAEKSTAKNIKSTATKKNVTNALDKITRYLKDYKKTPENGLAVFCGNISRIEGQDDLQLWDIEPPMPLKIRMYRCDKEFVLEPLKELLEIKEIYGLLVMDRKEATIGMLEGKRIETIHKMTSGIPSKVRAGGQCLSPDTIVFEKNKGPIILKEVEEKDNIRIYDLDSKKIIFGTVKKKWNVIKNKLYEILPVNVGNILGSEDHSFFVIEQDGAVVEKTAKELSLNDNLLYQDGSSSSIIKINVKEGKFDLIDLEVEGGNFIANEHVVHNSSQRFHRITEGLTRDFYKRIAGQMKEVFFENKKLKGILVGGPIPTKDEFIDEQYMVTKLREKIIGRIDIGGSDESGLKELVHKSQEILADQEIIHEKKLLERFFDHLGRKP
ncbi:MAG TPA: hypothetical protein ENG87_02680, partial [Candidatus Pacearchaeota archaeon]|nr:hypothetical protein [Candidatus Pacearchaeota archaeon]